jgi:glutathione synthase/RimK-type ligase-like ATP-grasp enzyme
MAVATGPVDIGTVQRIIWLFPDRESSRTVGKWNAAFWETYVDVAKELGLTYERTAPEAVTVDAMDFKNIKVYVDRERVMPENTIFITSPYTLPYQIQDTLNQFTLYSVLEHAGFYLPHPTKYAATFNDKLATLLFLKDSPIPPIPSVRVSSGRDLLYDDFLVTIENLTYTAFVKPANWMAARGINLAHDSHDIRGLLSLAQGAETVLVMQPYLGKSTMDYRLHMVDGKVHTVMTREPGPGAVYAQFSTGGKTYYVDCPPELKKAAKWFAKKIDIPYYCADFLHDGNQYWLSEIEPDGAIICPNPTDKKVVAQQRSIIRDRFLAYCKAHRAFFGAAR